MAVSSSVRFASWGSTAGHEARWEALEKHLGDREGLLVDCSGNTLFHFYDFKIRRFAHLLEDLESLVGGDNERHIAFHCWQTLPYCIL